MMRNHTLDTPINISAIAGISKADAPITDRHFVVENSLDLAPVDQIIWASIQEEINSLGAGEKLAIVMGEFHELPSHIMPQISIASNLTLWRDKAPNLQDRSFVYALEQPYNYLADRAKNIYDLYMTEQEEDLFQVYDATDHLVSKITLNNLDNSDFLPDMSLAPRSIERRHEVCLNNNIPIIFNDVADQLLLYLTHHDEIAYRIAHDGFGIDLLKEDIPMAPEISENNDTRGVEIRNACMVERSSERSERIILQQCGGAHLYGDQHTGSPYNKSLISQYEKAGYKTLGISFSFSSAEEDKMFNPRDLTEHNNHIIIEGLSPIGFNHSISRHTQRFQELDPALLIKEKHHIDSLTSAYSGASCPFKKPDIELPTDIELRNELIRIMATAPQI